VAAALASRSPSSLEAIVMSHRAARRRQSVGAVLDLDLRLASFMARQPDFAEGVRAQLVDRDRRPRWNPTSFAEVPVAALAAALEAPPRAA
jgi:enoyl-CoA hydratase